MIYFAYILDEGAASVMRSSNLIPNASYTTQREWNCHSPRQDTTKSRLESVMKYLTGDESERVDWNTV